MKNEGKYIAVDSYNNRFIVNNTHYAGENMKVPKFVVDMMKRSHYYYEFERHGADVARWCAAGYTIAIKKATPYTYAETFCKEVERLQKWVNKQDGGDCRIIKLPKETKHRDQYAIVTIFDPVMQRIEKYIQQ